MLKEGSEGEVLEKYARTLFETLEWDSAKIKEDADNLIGP